MRKSKDKNVFNKNIVFVITFLVIGLLILWLLDTYNLYPLGKVYQFTATEEHTILKLINGIKLDDAGYSIVVGDNNNYRTDINNEIAASTQFAGALQLEHIKSGIANEFTVNNANLIVVGNPNWNSLNKVLIGDWGYKSNITLVKIDETNGLKLIVAGTTSKNTIIALEILSNYTLHEQELSRNCVIIFESVIFGCDDSDYDGVSDSSDNCKSVKNSDQTDSNHNGIGDKCDFPVMTMIGDIDGDGINDTLVNTGVIGVSNATDGRLIVINTAESTINQDLNDDGDINDFVLRYYDINKKQVFNTGIRISKSTTMSVSENHIILKNYEGIWDYNDDINNDGDTNDAVIRDYNAETKSISIIVSGSPWWPYHSSPVIDKGIVLFDSANKLFYYKINTSEIIDTGISNPIQSAISFPLIAVDNGTLLFYNLLTNKIFKTNISSFEGYDYLGLKIRLSNYITAYDPINVKYYNLMNKKEKAIGLSSLGYIEYDISNNILALGFPLFFSSGASVKEILTFNIDTGKLTSSYTNMASGTTLRMGKNIIAFTVSEENPEIGSYGSFTNPFGIYQNSYEDYNADGDFNDTVIMYIQLSRQGDSDKDTIKDGEDICPQTPLGETANNEGCSISQRDSDWDGLFDINDQCPQTPYGESADTTGCSSSQKDEDKDGVTDLNDLCPHTPLNNQVDSKGCADIQKDSDLDGDSDNTDCMPQNPAIFNGALEICDNIDQNCNNKIDEGLQRINSTNIGECKKGTEVCINGLWEVNLSVVGPSVEICDGRDNDCNGIIDDGIYCACLINEERVCGINVGACKTGQQMCSNGRWGQCTNAITPTAEKCNLIDDDCNGVIDNNCLTITNIINDIRSSPAPKQFKIVIGRNAMSADSVGAIEVGALLGLDQIVFDDRINDVENKDLIIIGGPCVNEAANRLYGYPEVCTRSFSENHGTVKIIEFGNHKQIIIAGYSALDTRKAARAFANYLQYHDGFNCQIADIIGDLQTPIVSCVVSNVTSPITEITPVVTTPFIFFEDFNNMTINDGELLDNAKVSYYDLHWQKFLGDSTKLGFKTSNTQKCNLFGTSLGCGIQPEVDFGKNVAVFKMSGPKEIPVAYAIDISQLSHDITSGKITLEYWARQRSCQTNGFSLSVDDSGNTNPIYNNLIVLRYEADICNQKLYTRTSMLDYLQDTPQKYQLVMDLTNNKWDLNIFFPNGNLQSNTTNRDFIARTPGSFIKWIKVIGSDHNIPTTSGYYAIYNISMWVGGPTNKPVS